MMAAPVSACSIVRSCRHCLEATKGIAHHVVYQALRLETQPLQYMLL